MTPEEADSFIETLNYISSTTPDQASDLWLGAALLDAADQMPWYRFWTRREMRKDGLAQLRSALDSKRGEDS